VLDQRHVFESLAEHGPMVDCPGGAECRQMLRERSVEIAPGPQRTAPDVARSEYTFEVADLLVSCDGLVGVGERAVDIGAPEGEARQLLVSHTDQMPVAGGPSGGQPVGHEGVGVGGVSVERGAGPEDPAHSGTPHVLVFVGQPDRLITAGLRGVEVTEAPLSHRQCVQAVSDLNPIVGFPTADDRVSRQCLGPSQLTQRRHDQRQAPADLRSLAPRQNVELQHGLELGRGVGQRPVECSEPTEGSGQSSRPWAVTDCDHPVQGGPMVGQVGTGPSQPGELVMATNADLGPLRQLHMEPGVSIPGGVGVEVLQRLGTQVVQEPEAVAVDPGDHRVSDQ
jgi:hypothetical protein